MEVINMKLDEIKLQNAEILKLLKKEKISENNQNIDYELQTQQAILDLDGIIVPDKGMSDSIFQKSSKKRTGGFW